MAFCTTQMEKNVEEEDEVDTSQALIPGSPAQLKGGQQTVAMCILQAGKETRVRMSFQHWYATGSILIGLLTASSTSRSRGSSYDRLTRDSLMSGARRHGLRVTCDHGRYGACHECERSLIKYQEKAIFDRGRSIIRHTGNRRDSLSSSDARDRLVRFPPKYDDPWERPGARGNATRRHRRTRDRSRSRSRSRSWSWSRSPHRTAPARVQNNVTFNLSNDGGTWHRKGHGHKHRKHRRHRHRGRAGSRSRSRSRSESRDLGRRGNGHGHNRGILIHNTQSFHRRYSRDRY